MDQKKIGKFIASLRKEKGLTQSQLANLLNLSDRTISKWERGAGLPDTHLMLPLCSELGISVNELLDGERIPEERFATSAEENVMELLNRYKKRTSRIIFIMVALFYFAAVSFSFLISDRMVTKTYMLVSESFIGTIEEEMQDAKSSGSIDIFRQNIPVYEANNEYPVCVILKDSLGQIVAKTTADTAGELYQTALNAAENGKSGHNGFIDYMVTADSFLYASEFDCGGEKYTVSAYSRINQIGETFRSEYFLFAVLVLTTGIVLFIAGFIISNKVLNRNVLKVK